MNAFLVNAVVSFLAAMVLHELGHHFRGKHRGETGYSGTSGLMRSISDNIKADNEMNQKVFKPFFERTNPRY